MRRLAFLILALLTGCATTGGLFVAPRESAARQPLRQKAVGLVEKQLKRDGWVGEVVSVTRTGVLAPTVTDGWSEETITLDVTAKDADGRAVAIPVADYNPTLDALRRKLRDLVEDNGGGQVDWQILEAYHERTLVFLYKVGDVAGTVRVRMAPKADTPDELVTRIEFTVREQ